MRQLWKMRRTGKEAVAPWLGRRPLERMHGAGLPIVSARPMLFKQAGIAGHAPMLMEPGSMAPS
jgi:hypothetical protein